MTLSVNTNPGALIALQNLNATESQLQKAQNQVSTGLAIASPQDNGAIWAIAQNQRATSLSLDSVTQSLQRAQSTIDVATSAGTSVSDLLNQLKSKALAASDQSLDTNSRSALNADFTSILSQISTVVSNASFNGANLIESGGKSIFALANADGTSQLTVTAQDLSLGGANITLTATSSIGTATLAQSAIATINTSIDNVNNALAKLGTSSNALTTQLTFVGNLCRTPSTPASAIWSTPTSPRKAPSSRPCRQSSSSVSRPSPSPTPEAPPYSRSSDKTIPWEAGNRARPPRKPGGAGRLTGVRRHEQQHQHTPPPEPLRTPPTARHIPRRRGLALIRQRRNQRRPGRPTPPICASLSKTTKRPDLTSTKPLIGVPERSFQQLPREQILRLREASDYTAGAVIKAKV